MKKWLWLVFISSALAADFPILSQGTTHLTYIDKNQQEAHSIMCYHQVELDIHFNYLQCLSSSHDLRRQIHFHDDLHDLYSDQLRATYTYKDDILELDKLTIYGNVCLIQKKSAQDVIAFDELQYALADQLDYDYKQSQILLQSKENSRVLYYDTMNNYKMSAQKVMMRRNSQLDDFELQSIGKVHFAFQDDELEKFKKHFSGKAKEPGL